MVPRRRRPLETRRRGGALLTELRYRALTLCIASLLFALVGYELGRRPADAVVFVGFVASALLFLFASNWPWLPFAAGLFLLALVPVYWVPFTFHVLPLPGVVIFAMVAGVSVLACLGRREAMSLSGLDVLVALLMLSLGLSAAVHERKFIDFFDNVLQWGVPYLAARISVGRAVSAATFARIFSFAGLVLVPFVALETLTGENLFAKFSHNVGEAAVWGVPLYRGSFLRAQASFGHPIALSMFLGSATVFAGALAVGGSVRASRERWTAAAVALGVATLATVSRTGEVVLVVALLGSAALFATSPVDYRTRRRALGFIATAVGVLAVAFVASSRTRTLVLSVFGSDSGAAGTASYRLNLLSVAGTKYFSWFGQRTSAFTQAGIGSVDNAYLYMLSVWGVFATAMLVATLVPMVRYLLQRRSYPSMRTVIVAVAVGNLVGLVFVAPITQEQDVIFVLLGAAAGALVSGARADLVARASGMGRRSTALRAESSGRPSPAAPADAQAVVQVCDRFGRALPSLQLMVCVAAPADLSSPVSVPHACANPVGAAQHDNSVGRMTVTVLAPDDPYDPSANSGGAYGLIVALQELGVTTLRTFRGLRPWMRYVLAGATFGAWAARGKVAPTCQALRGALHRRLDGAQLPARQGQLGGAEPRAARRPTRYGIAVGIGLRQGSSSLLLGHLRRHDGNAARSS